MKRSKLLAILGAAALTIGSVGVALATDLLDGQAGKTLGEFKQENCDTFPLEIGDGEIGVHFVLNGTSDTSGLLDAEFSTDSIVDLPNSDSPANVLHWYAVITGDLDTVLESASTDADGNNLVLSHVCPGGTTTTTTEETTTEETTTEETTTEETTSEQSTTTQETTTTTSFTGSEQELTEPPTDTVGTNGTSNPANSAWLLVVALGGLLASLVILAPAKSRR